jgi:ethanolamine utilization protein EutP (predicted NTPase)
MKLKASHHWRTDGTIVIEIRDHDAKQNMLPKNTHLPSVTYGVFHPQVNALVTTMDLPRGTPKADVKLAKKSLIMAMEVQMNEVSR